MAETTQIQPDKVRAYLATYYLLGHAEQGAGLYIEQRSEHLARLRAHNGVNCGAFWSTLIPSNHGKRVCHADWGQRIGGTILKRSPNRGAGLQFSRLCQTSQPLFSYCLQRTQHDSAKRGQRQGTRPTCRQASGTGTPGHRRLRQRRRKGMTCREELLRFGVGPRACQSHGHPL